MKEYGLVLAGGGTKGAYEVGAWRALKELNLNITAVVGTSIGAINAALILQDDFNNMLKLYDTIQLNNVLDVDKKIDTNKNIFNITNIARLAKDFAKNGRYTNEPLRKMINEYINVDKIYDSKLEFGMVTYSVKNKSTVEMFKEDIPKDKMVEYLLATACFPVYKAQKIDDEKYLDGGVSDNIPVNMLIKKGYKNIIVIDISKEGIKRKLIDKKAYVKLIRANEDLGGVFEFNKERFTHNMLLGYLDTMKAFNKLQGHIFYLQNDEFNKLLKIFNLQTVYGLEYAAKIYKMDRYKIYEYKEFLNELDMKHKEAILKYEKVRKDLDFVKIVRHKDELKKILDKGLGLCLMQDMITNKPSFRNIKLINKLFSDYILASEALIELTNYN